MQNSSIKEDFKNRDKLLKEKTNIADLIDHTLLKMDAQENDFLVLFEQANEYKFKSVCVPTSVVKMAKKHCKSSLICTVIGFPNGYATTVNKVTEMHEALENGADEIDFVNNVILVKSQKWDDVLKEYCEIVKSSQNKVTKVILETSLLTEKEIIQCTELAAHAGVNIIKTSTGFGKRGASVEDIVLIKATLQKISEKNKTLIGIKASGGVRTFEDALKMIQNGATRIGTSNGPAIVKESMSICS